MLEREINTGADHTEVVVRSIHHIPTEITNPPDVQSKTDFDAATKLANSLRLGTSLTSTNVKCGNRAEESGNLLYNEMCPFSATKNPATACEDVRCKTSARNWITQGE